MAKQPKKQARQEPIEYITPPNTLRAKLKADRPAVDDALAAAERALKILAPETEEWVDQEINRLQKCRQVFAQKPNDEKALHALAGAAMDVKGLAGLTNNKAADKFATSLVALVTDPSKCALGQAGLVEAHVDAIRATREPSYDASVADALAAELAALSSACITAANKMAKSA